MTLVRCRDLPIFVSERFPKKMFEAAMDYKPKDGDVIVAAYPKTGTTWVQYITWQILHYGETYPSFDEATFHLMPYMDVAGVDVVEKLKPPRFYKTHLPYNKLDINPKAKYIYVHRNPGDTLVSYFYFWNDMRDARAMKFIPEDEFFDLFISGEISYGNYFDHVLSFYPHRNDPNVLFMSYEDLKQDSPGQILRIAKFLGGDYYSRLSEDDTLFKKVLEVTSFEYMKKHLKLSKIPLTKENDQITSEITEEEHKGPANFFRKGVVGDGNSQLTLDQRKILLQKVLEKMENTELLEPWRRSIAA